MNIPETLRGAGQLAHVGPDLSGRIATAVDRDAGAVIALSHALHADPELSGQEYRSAQRVRELLAERGFDFPAEQPEAPTAFCANAGDGALTVALCVEYDALPDIGHACGHNVNGAAAVAAALALADVASELGITVRVLGTPAEETTGGKVDLIREGFFDDVSVALMAHAAAYDSIGSTSLALSAWNVEYAGASAHAAVAPHDGVNALDGLVVAQIAIGMARQQLPPGAIVSLIVLEGGNAVNIIPSSARARLEMRAPTAEILTVIQDKIRNCLAAGALASGAELTVTPIGNDFADLRQDDFLSNAYRQAMLDRGRDVVLESTALGSTDMGNVSHVAAAIHPSLGYELHGTTPHTSGFASHGASPSADTAILDGAYGLAMAAASAALDPSERSRLIGK